MKGSLMTHDSLTETTNRSHLHVLILSKQNLWMNEDIPWSCCCKVKSWAKRICFCFYCSLRENSFFEQGLYCVTLWLNNILFYSMNLFWECIMLIRSSFQFTMLIKGHMIFCCTLWGGQPILNMDWIEQIFELNRFLLLATVSWIQYI